jgi:uncharacterized protein
LYKKTPFLGLTFVQKYAKIGLISVQFQEEDSMRRFIDKYLLEWKTSRLRMPLLIRGARQVGKTYAVRHLGKTFDDFVEINFEHNPEFASAFERNLEPTRIIEDLEIRLKRPIIPGKTLLFFDEVQESVKAFKSLRYFYELMPSLHVIAAGSLLDFQIEKIGVPVGRVEWLYLYPMSFIEFLYAVDHTLLAEKILNHHPDELMSDSTHNLALSLLGEYIAIGGMPAVVKCWRDSRDIADCGRLLHRIIQNYKQDFDKYARRSQVKYLDILFDHIPKLLGRKFKYSQVSQHYKARELEPSLAMLCMAGIATKVLESAGQGLPLGAQANDKHFKVLFLDIALSQVVLGFELGEWIIEPYKEFINQGELVEAFVGQELLAYSSPFVERHLYYWHREERGSLAEVDYLIQKEKSVIPIEVKSGTGKALQSMSLFLETHPSSPYGIKLSPQNFSVKGKIHTYPLYAIAHFTRNVKNPLTIT